MAQGGLGEALLHFGLCQCLPEPSVRVLLAVPWNKGWDSTTCIQSSGFLSCPASQAAWSASPACSEPLPWNSKHQEPRRVGADLAEDRAGGCAALPVPCCCWGGFGGVFPMEMRESPGCGEGMVRLESPTPPGGIWALLLASSSPLCPRVFPQVQERCDYDLVTPLALLFYSAVLYVSAEAAAGPSPGQAPKSGWNIPAFISSSPKERFCVNPEGSGSSTHCTS